MNRRLFKLLSWDYVTNEGLATDGSSYEGERITFIVPQVNLSPEHDGYLVHGDLFTAGENPDHTLTDIIIEKSSIPGRAMARPLSDSLIEEEPARPQVEYIQTEDFQSGSSDHETETPRLTLPEVISILSEKVRDLESRVKGLETEVYEDIDPTNQKASVRA